VEEIRDDREETAFARAFAAMLLACSAAGLVFAGILTNFQGGFYIPLLMPYLLGRAAGGLAVGVGQRSSYEVPEWSAKTSAILGALITVLGYHLLAYQAVFSLLEKDAIPDLATWLLEVTGSEGFSAYVILATDPELQFSGHISPFGIAGAVLSSPAAFYGALVLELGAAALGASQGVRRGLTSKSAHGSAGGDWRLVAQIGAEELQPVLQALDDDNFVRAGKRIAESEPDPEIRISILFPENDAYPHILQVAAQSSGSIRATYKISIDQALLMMDQIRLAEAKRLYSDNDSSSA